MTFVMEKYMQTKPDISIIIPCYNTSATLERCFNSIYHQTIEFDRLEIIFVDDLSTDDTYLKIKQLAAKYPHSVKAFQVKKKGYAGGARNVGIDQALGEYIFFMDADDYLDSSALYKMYVKAEESNCDYVQCHFKVTFSVDDSGKRIGDDELIVIENDEDRKKFICNHISVDAWGKLFRTNFIRENNLYFQEGYLYESIYFTGVLIFLAKKVYYLKEELYFYWQNEQSIMHYAYNIENEKHFISLMDKLNETLIQRKLWDKIKEDYWKEYQFYVTCKSLYDPMMRLMFAYDEQKDYLLKTISSRFPDLLNNQIVMGYQSLIAKKCRDYLRQNRSIWDKNEDESDFLRYQKQKKNEYNRLVAGGRSCLSAIRETNCEILGDISNIESQITQIDTVEAYFEKLRAHGLIAILSGMDDCSIQYNNFVNQARLPSTIAPAFRAGYIAITDGNSFGYSRSEVGPAIEYSCQLRIPVSGWRIIDSNMSNTYVHVKVMSMGFQTDLDGFSYSSIMIDNIEYSCMGRGINGVVIDTDGKVIDVWNIDLHGDPSLHMRRNIQRG